jgi:hypothetical protein
MTKGVLRMPPELWSNSALDVMQRHQRYVDAANTMDRQEAEIEKLRLAMVRLLASDKGIASATDKDLLSASTDSKADEQIREQAAAVLQCRAALSLDPEAIKESQGQPGTIDALLNELKALKETLGGDCEVVVMKYFGGEDEPSYVKAVAPSSDDGGRVILDTTYFVRAGW